MFCTKSSVVVFYYVLDYVHFIVFMIVFIVCMYSTLCVLNK